MPEFIQKYWIEVLFGGIIAMFSFYFKYVTNKVIKKVKQYEYLGEGVKALLYDRLRQAYNFHMKNGCISIDDYNYFYSLHDSYHKLGGNGTGSEMLSRLKELPAPLQKKE